MATLFKRLNHYCLTHKKQPPDSEQIKELGKKIAHHYFTTKDPKRVFDHAYFYTENGPVKIACYPKNFIPEIDRMIDEFYQSITPKIRKRIPVKPTLERSFKPSNPNL